ncbi:MAG: gliding motility-associated C-terminal domain-containing protein [Bacteroidales bacterium]|nr:gliding motility-associated C-terminal domain-containing protein [Bacteroidales bacterium]
MEHSFIGDVTVSIICPTGQEAFLWFGNQDNTTREANTSGGAGYGGGGTNLGYAYDYSTGCDSLDNPFGGGLDYCFSRNGDYTLVTGERADAVVGRPIRTGATNCYITGTNFIDSYSNEVVGPQPTYFRSSAGQTFTLSGSTKHPSDHVNKTDYYIPYTDFSELIGCPLNGTWRIKVNDKWGADNGWVFNWGMDICGVTQDDDCKYTVALDSLIWRPDPSPQYHDYDLGRYRGLVVEKATPSLSYISSPDTAGTFPIDVFVYDEFGCVWDTNTRITTYWTPEPRLGADTSLCGVDLATFDATDRHTATENYTYVWSPFGQNTPTIETQEDATGVIDYVASVINHCGPDNRMQCKGRDTIRVFVRKQPLPNFTPEPFTFEGCDPLTITFNNQSIDASEHLWVFGDGVTSTLESPTHTYAEGIYTLKYYATSDEGCVDSIVSEGGIAVFPKPNASFNWNPVYPSVLNPVVTYVNTTTPHTSNTQYFWELQYDRNNPLSFETLTTRNATFDYSRYNEDVSGNYNVRLIAQTKNLAPSGNLIYCVDTAANNVLVINDFLQFPNVVTPNGDGINDRFVIQNLVDGLGYPINSLDIYNQWGARVYHRENIDSEDDFWDPADVPDGTYFYRFSARGYNGNIEHNGSIEVIH